MIKAAFCDDDPAALEEKSGMLEKYRASRNQEIAYTMFRSPLELLMQIEKGMRWDILFLDILMPGQNGIDMAKEIRRIDLEKLEYCEVIKRTLIFHMTNGEVFEGSGGMDELYKTLMPYGHFLRPHRSFLVNMEYIQSISYKKITMRRNVNIPIPHGKYSTVKEAYLAYAFHRKLVFMS